MRSSPLRPFHPIYPFPFFLPPPFFGAEKPLACDRPVVRATAHRPAAAVPPRTTPGRPGWALPTDSSVTYYQRTTPDLRDESQSEGVRRGGNSPEHEAPTPRYSISSTSWTVCPLVIRYYLPLACRAPGADPPPQRWWGGGGGQIVSSRAHFADVLVMVLPCACRQAVHACLPGPTNAAVSSSASWSGLQHSSVRPLPVNSRYLY